MNPDQFLSECRVYLESCRDSQNAVAMKRYMRDQFDFYGIKAEPRKHFVKLTKLEFRAFTVEQKEYFVRQAWNQPQREWQLLALDFLTDVSKKAPVEFNQLYYDLILTKSWWDTVDGIASNLVGSLWKREAQIKIENFQDWIGHSNFWINRTAIIHQLKYGKETSASDLERSILPHIHSDEFFIRKAIGWSLRQYSRFNPHWVQDFVDEHPEMSGLSKREALKLL